ncbi:hypothetical protein KKHLCK_02275 [Candidatus Electrothrix laxa]
MADWKRAVARLYQGRRDEGGVYRGTAFMISNRHLLTCFHVVRDLTKDDIRLYDVAAWDAGVRKVREIISDENIDIALLELVEPTQDADLVSVCRELDDTAAYKNLECTGFSSVSGDRNYFSVQVGSYDGEYNLYDFPVPVGKGMSGSPLVYQNQLMGVSRLQDERKTYLIPLRDFQDLLNEHVFPEGDNIETTPEPEVNLDGTKIPTTEFDQTIQERINELFKADDFQEVRKKICELAGQKDSSNIGELLCSSNIAIESAVGWLNQAAAEVVQAMPKGVEEEQRREAFKDTAAKILGWLVLRTVDPAWVEQHGSELLKEQGACLTVRLDYTSCAEVIVARTFQRESRFQGTYKTVQGRDAVGCVSTEGGIEPAPNAEALFKNVYHQVWRKEITGAVTNKHKKELLRLMRNRFRSGLRYYLTVSLDELEASLTEDDLRQFHNQYPYLKLILLRMNSGESALLVEDDGDLYDLITTFFFRVIEEQA